MKKTVLLAASSVLVGFSAMAESLPQPTIPPVIIVKEYFGTKASNNPNNPCKGETTRICYRETQTASQWTPGKVKITKIGENENGRIVNAEENIVDGTIESVVNEMRMSLPYNATVKTVPVNGTQIDK